MRPDNISDAAFFVGASFAAILAAIYVASPIIIVWRLGTIIRLMKEHHAEVMTNLRSRK